MRRKSGKRQSPVRRAGADHAETPMPTDPTEIIVEVLVALGHPEDEAREIERFSRPTASGRSSEGDGADGSPPPWFGPADLN